MDEVTIFAVVCMVVLLKRKRTRHYITKQSLNKPSESAWQVLYDSKQDGAYVDTMGFDVVSFHLLHDAVQARNPTPHAMMGGRPSTLNSYARLG